MHSDLRPASIQFMPASATGLIRSAAGEWVDTRSAPPLSGCCERCIREPQCTSFGVTADGRCLVHFEQQHEPAPREALELGVPLLIEPTDVLERTSRRLESTRSQDEAGSHAPSPQSDARCVPMAERARRDETVNCGAPLLLGGEGVCARLCKDLATSSDVAASTQPANGTGLQTIGHLAVAGIGALNIGVPLAATLTAGLAPQRDRRESGAFYRSLSLITLHLASRLPARQQMAGASLLIGCGPVCVPFGTNNSEGAGASYAGDSYAGAGSTWPPAGWVYDGSAGCYRAYYHNTHHPCSDSTYGSLVFREAARLAQAVALLENTSTTTANAASGRVAASSSTCDQCAEPQKHEACYDRVISHLKLNGTHGSQQVRLSPQLAAASASKAAPSFVDGQLALYEWGLCPRPCRSGEAAPMLSDRLSAAERRTWLGDWALRSHRSVEEWSRRLSAPWTNGAERAVGLLEWQRLVRYELDAGWLLSRACARRAATRRNDAQGYVTIRNAREQMHKSKFVALDALFIADSLGRALIEPRVSDSRLGQIRSKHSSGQAVGGGPPAPPKVRPRPSDDDEARRLSDSERTSGIERQGDLNLHDDVVTSRLREKPSSSITKRNFSAGSTPAHEDPFHQLLLHHYWDLEPFCQKFDVIPPSSYVRGRKGWQRERVRISPYRRHSGIGRFRLRTRAAVRRAFGRINKVSRILELDGWWRSVSNREAMSKEGALLNYEGVQLGPSAWELNPAYTRLASLLVGTFLSPGRVSSNVPAVASDAMGKRHDDDLKGCNKGAIQLEADVDVQWAGEEPSGFLAVQWRSEDGGAILNTNETTARAGFAPCAGWAAERILRALREHNLSTAFLATDLRRGASSTYGVSGAQEAALAHLHAAVPALGGPAAVRLRQLIDAIGDSGVRAGIEAAICVRGTALLSTATVCRSCKRALRCSKYGSAFAKYILQRRQDFAMPPAQPLFT